MKIIFLGFLIFLLVILFYLDDNILSYAEEKEIVIRDEMFKTDEYVSGLIDPVMIDFIGDHVLVAEKNGNVRIIKDGVLVQESVSGVPEVLFAGQGGLSGIILDPNFKDNNRLFIAFSSPDEGKATNTLEVISAILDQNSLINVNTIFKASPSRRTAAHYGARMAFLDDGTLLITSGDGFNYREDAQYLDNHFGKIIRINSDGSIPEDNPYIDIQNALPEIFSYGHRNQQGIAYDSKNDILYSNEHGPRGGDELNLITAGKNYGWPAITYGIDYNGSIISPFTEKVGMEQPLTYWVPSIAPSDMIFYDGEMFPEFNNNLIISSLVPGEIRKISFDNNALEEEIIFDEIKGRIRSIKSSTNGALVVLSDGPKGEAYIINR